MEDRLSRITQVKCDVERIWLEKVGQFDSAAACFERSASTDRPASIFLDRAKQLAANPPGGDWDSIRTLESK